MDIADTLAPKSDQMDYVDLIAGPMTLTIKAVRKGPSPDQPVQIDFHEFPRPWRPSKTVRRVIAKCWGTDSTVYVGRQVTLYGDPTVKFGGAEVGGIRLSHASHIDNELVIPVMIARGKSAPYTVTPLETKPDTNVQDAIRDLTAASSLPALKAAWDLATALKVANHPDGIAAKDKRKTELSEAPAREQELS
jgi:hypothetical protein